MRHVRNRFVLLRLFKAFGEIYFTISKFRQKHEYLQYKKLETKPNQLLHQPSPAHHRQQKRIPTVTNIETDNNNKKTQTRHRKKKQLDM